MEKGHQKEAGSVEKLSERPPKAKNMCQTNWKLDPILSESDRIGLVLLIPLGISR